MFYPRPQMCPEPRCQPLYQWPPPTKKQIDKGIRTDPTEESWHCFGYMKEEIVFIYNDDKHANDLHSCCYTPLKGLIVWQENRDDWYGMKRCYTRALKRLDEIRNLKETKETKQKGEK